MSGGLIPQSFIDELIARTDIVDVIGARVPLKKAGREFKACCPFHDEKTASFWVSPEKQFYHCFGCGAHGTVLRFLMEYDRMAFPEAIEDLAQRLGLTVPHEQTPGGTAAARIEDSLYDTMARVQRHYTDCLEADARARAYLQRRGLTRETIEHFGIGYAVNSWNDVLKRFGREEQQRRQLAELGLIIERERGKGPEGDRHYDRFRDRIMFPIRDVRGRVIAFGGRVIDQGEPKYLNSPETPLFHKGRELYALFEARRTRPALKRLLVVEGYMDVARLHQFGITYSVATLGTATTPEHFRRIFRLVSAVVFAFDGDRAGRAAAWRALQHALPETREGREIRFLFLPEGHDPDTLVAAEGREAFEQRIETAALPLSEYLVRELSEQADLTHADGRARFAELARPLLARIAPGLYRELLLARIAEVVGLPVERLRELWNPQLPAGSERESARASRPTAAARARVSAGRGSLIRQAIVSLMTFPAIAAEISPQEQSRLAGSEEPGAELLNGLLDDLRAHPATTAAQVIERWADKPEGEVLSRLLQREQVVSDRAAAARELKAALSRLAQRHLERQLERLEQMSRSRTLSDEELKEFQRLMSELGPRDARGGNP